MDLIKVAEEAFATGKQHPSFKAGDTVTVAYKIIEGSKERIQLFRGVVIKISGHQEKKRFTVRKMSGTVGVERIFPLESPNIESIEVNKVGKVRRAKLYYLRKLTGKAARIKEGVILRKNHKKETLTDWVSLFSCPCSSPRDDDHHKRSHHQGRHALSLGTSPSPESQPTWIIDPASYGWASSTTHAPQPPSVCEAHVSFSP